MLRMKPPIGKEWDGSIEMPSKDFTQVYHTLSTNKNLNLEERKQPFTDTSIRDKSLFKQGL